MVKPQSFEELHLDGSFKSKPPTITPFGRKSPDKVIARDIEIKVPSGIQWPDGQVGSIRWILTRYIFKLKPLAFTPSGHKLPDKVIASNIHIKVPSGIEEPDGKVITSRGRMN